MLRFLENQAQGAKAGESGTPDSRDAGQASLMGFMNKPKIVIEKDPTLEKIKQSLQNIDPDSLSPRDAHEAIYHLRNLLGDKK